MIGVKQKRGLLAWQKTALSGLKKKFLPPQRYGTAFHITPPFNDVRAWPVSTEISANQFENDFEQLLADEKKLMLGLSLDDVYFAWQVAHLDQVPLIIRRLQGVQSLLLQEAGLYFIFLDEGAELSVTDLGGDALSIRRVFVWQKAGSELIYTALRTGVTFLNEHMQVELVGEEATTTITHLVIGKQAEQGDISVTVGHKAPRTKSQVQVRAVAQDKARVIYRGLIDVDNCAVGTQGYQAGRALLLSRQATVDMLPQLEIRTNDVRCSHGVNTTHLDDSSLFYLQSKGLGREVARRLAITGFFHDKMSLPKTVGQALAKVIATL